MNKTSKIKLVRLRGRNQITLPTEVIDTLSLEEGDYLAAVSGEDGTIRLRPAKLNVAGTPEAERAISRAEADLEAGRSKKFDNLEEFKNEMRSSHREQMKEMEPQRSAMLVHVWPRFTTVTIQRHNIPVFSRTIVIGSRTSGTIQKLAMEIRKTMEFFQATAGGPHVSRVFLSVAPPGVTGMAEGLEKALGIKVEESPAVTAAVRHVNQILEGSHFYPSIDVGYEFNSLPTIKK